MASPLKVLLVSSVGGHLTELLALAGALDGVSRVWVLNDASPLLPGEDVSYEISHSERDWRTAWNLAEMASIIGHEQPQVMLSTGAGLAVPAALACRASGIPVIYVEPSSAVTRLTLTGRLMRHLANRYYVQWESLRRAAPWADFAGGLL